MRTFNEYQTFAIMVPVALRNNRDRIDLPVVGLQQEAAKVGSLLAAACVSGRFTLTERQRDEIKARLSDVLWHLALLCGESGLSLEDVAEHSVAQLQARTSGLDPERR
jgi:hypothetical protein